ncbi:gluconokinase [Oculatella sp. LEGE 06141]|uniref:gluconokinase n=1 Tax=Oculatella sp. LEGE 06141 TaxID=1828648 RepID=UPI00187FB9D9|nr:gluconokinase [Oculatella sp. LEGE 06141]MBE9179552.1 gluconokinase [Oculatella sp. LEGE 06141]
MAYFIGIDIGTTSTKAIVFSETGVMKGIANYKYDLLAPKPGWSEQDPEELFKAVVTTIRDAIQTTNCSAQEIGAIGVSSAMHSLIAVDADNYPLTNSIIWADSRSFAQAERLKQDDTGFKIYQRTGTPIHPMSPLTKLMWLRDNEPELFRQAAKFISVKEYVLYQLFGRYVVDYSIASATGLFNLTTLDWDAEALAIAGIHPGQLSELVPTTYILRGMKARCAEMTGLDPDTPFVVGASDGVLANLGVGAISPDQVAITIGTSGAVRMVVPQPVTDRQGRTFCYALTENHWVIGGATNSAGIVLRWFRDRFCQVEVQRAEREHLDPYDIIIQEAATVPAGSAGLLCLPFLSGERAPHWNTDARGVFFGVALHHERAHFIRAVLEGILYAVYDVTVILQELGGDSHTIRASGGFARSKAWRQMMADLFGYEVLAPEVYEGSGFGAAALAMHAVGALPNLLDVQGLIRITDRHQPDLKLTQTYHSLFESYRRLYNDLVDEFSVIATYQRQASGLD